MINGEILTFEEGYNRIFIENHELEQSLINNSLLASHLRLTKSLYPPD